MLGSNLQEELHYRGVTHRQFLKFCTVMAGTLALPHGFAGKIAEALAEPARTPVIWLEFQDCAGCTESFLRASRPTVAELVLDMLNTDEKYTWMKAPRLADELMEVGPLARILVAYASGQERVQAVVNSVLETLGVGPEVLFSTLGRTAARCVETVIMAEKLAEWTQELSDSMASGDYKIHEWSAWDPEGWPAEAKGWGFTEAPRGALGHWVHIKDQKIHNYQAVVPSTWNSSPRDAQGKPGAYEAALIGTPIENPEEPLEILRTVHSFDRCMACGVHILDAQGREITQVVVQGTSRC